MAFTSANGDSGAGMRFASALFRHIGRAAQPADVVAQVLAEQIRADDNVGAASIDLALVFLSPHYVPAAQALVQHLREKLSPRVLIGCSAESVIVSEHEVEGEAAVAVLAAHLPGVEITPFHLSATSVDEWRDTMASALAFRQRLGVPHLPKLFVMLGDPFSTPIEALLEAFNAYYVGAPVMGGMASSARQPASNAILINDHVDHFGAVGVALSGNVEVDVIVSQGCRPIGHTYKVTSTSENLIFSLNGGSPLRQVQDMVDGLDDVDRTLLRNGLYVGRAVRTLTPENKEDALGRGDFLIRSVMGGDQTSGAIAIGDQLGEGEIVQFHVRDAKTAEEDLDLMLAPQGLYDPPAGALLFSCNGRGTHLYDKPNGDIAVVQRALGATKPMPLAGFFCAGEIGPIGGSNFLHSHTASLVLFRPSPSSPPSAETETK